MKRVWINPKECFNEEEFWNTPQVCEQDEYSLQDIIFYYNLSDSISPEMIKNLELWSSEHTVGKINVYSYYGEVKSITRICLYVIIYF